MFVSVAICTWNRCALLRQTLEEFTHLMIPPEVEWELLVVNNGCTDATDEVITSFSTRLPVRRLSEPQPGLSNARNRAVREARGEYVLWTDDDIFVDRNWLASYVEAFVQWPETAVFGGPIRPRFAAPPPAWLERVWPTVCGYYGVLDLGPTPLQLGGSARATPYGANFAVRMLEQRRCPYDPELGLKHEQRRVGEETRLVEGLLGAGYDGRWVPRAEVSHIIQAGHMTTRHIRRYSTGYGQYLAKTEPAWDGPLLFGKPRWLWRHAVTREVTFRIHRIFRPPEVWIQDLIVASEAWGRLRA